MPFRLPMLRYFAMSAPICRYFHLDFAAADVAAFHALLLLLLDAPEIRRDATPHDADVATRSPL